MFVWKLQNNVKNKRSVEIIMKILMLVNWKVKKCSTVPEDMQPPDYIIKDNDYWFYRYFETKPDVDIIDISSITFWEKIEKNIFRFYIWQAIKAILRMNKYDLVVSHGMQSGVVVSLWRRIFRTKVKHIVFDIGSFNSAAESGFALKLMQFSSHSIDNIIYHTSSQIDYYKSFFPWLVNNCNFVKFGTDLEFFKTKINCNSDNNMEKYIVCIGYTKRDWDTLVTAYQMLNTDIKLRLIGHVDEKYQNIKGVEQIPFVSIKELKEYIKNSLFCVLPLKSFNYSYGQMTLMQQMAMKKCVIVADVPSLRDYIDDMETAVIYEPLNCFDLSKKIEWIIENQDVMYRIGINARRELEMNCNEEKMAHEIESIFINAISKKESK